MDYTAAIAGASAGILTAVIAATFIFVRRHLNQRKFHKYLIQITEEGRKKIEQASREISELTFRDASGKLCKVKIVVDHSLPEKLTQMAQEGSLQDLMSNHKVSEDAMGQVEEFVFSPRAVHDMRQAGMEPDDVVREMLRAAGRIT